MTTPVRALDCPKCGAQLGASTEGGSYVCAHCGERSIPEVRIQVQQVVGPQQFNVVASQAEIDERKREFDANVAKHQWVKDASDRASPTTTKTAKAVLIGVAVFVVLILMGTLMLVLVVLGYWHP